MLVWPGVSVAPLRITAAVFFNLALARSANAARSQSTNGGMADGVGGERASGGVMRHAGSAWLAATYIDAQDSAAHAAVACELGAAAYSVRRYEVGAALFARALEAYHSLMANAAVPSRPEEEGEEGEEEEEEGEEESDEEEDMDEEDEESVILHVAEAMNNLAACAAGMGDAPAAVRLYRRCHALLVSELKPSHPAMMIVLHNLSRQLRMPGVPLTLYGTMKLPPPEEPRLWVSFSTGNLKGGGGKKKKKKKGKGGKKKGGKGSPRKSSPKRKKK